MRVLLCHRYAFGSVIACASYAHSAMTENSHGRNAHIGFFEGYTPLAIMLVLFQVSSSNRQTHTHAHTPSLDLTHTFATLLLQAFHGLAVALVYKYADAIVKNFANSSVMAILIVISYLYFALQTTIHSWLGIIIVLTTTYCYMNIALRLPVPKPEVTQTEKAHLLEEAREGGGTSETEGEPTPAKR